MKINRVTITGADDSVSPEGLFYISQQYPFVEWGILLSKNNMGVNRFPSEAWLTKLFLLSREHKINLSGHLCGTWVKDICFGKGFTFIDDYPEFATMFKRFQLNFHAITHQINEKPFIATLKGDIFKDVQFIFQLDDVNNKILDIARSNGINAVPLFDTSGGIGKLPDAWPEIRQGMYCGYAGGLSPNNITDQLDKIEQVVGANEIWIDVETKVRSNHDTTFDINLVLDFIKKVDNWNKK